MKLILATNNEHKLSEIRSILSNDIEILSLRDIDFNQEIDENGSTLTENANIKAACVAAYLNDIKFPCPWKVAADDTGLMVDELNGEPGVHSARYAGGEGHDSEANMKLLLKKLENKENRNAHFSTVINLIEQEDENNCKTSVFEGRIDGKILTEKHGAEGFGYDPIFQPEGYEKSFAELGMDIKNKISHRARAVAKLAEYLHNTNK